MRHKLGTFTSVASMTSHFIRRRSVFSYRFRSIITSLHVRRREHIPEPDRSVPCRKRLGPMASKLVHPHAHIQHVRACTKPTPVRVTHELSMLVMFLMLSSYMSRLKSAEPQPGMKMRSSSSSNAAHEQRKATTSAKVASATSCPERVLIRCGFAEDELPPHHPPCQPPHPPHRHHPRVRRACRSRALCHSAAGRLCLPPRHPLHTSERGV